MSISTPSPALADYVQLPFTTDANDLADDAISWLQGQWPDWQPNDGDPEVVVIEGVAPMAANAAQIASNMPPAALIALGTKLLNIPYEEGQPATATAIFTVQDANGPYQIDADAEIDISGVAFQTTEDLVIPNGQTTGTVQVVATDVGVLGNNLSGADWVSVGLPIYVTGFALQAPTTGGVDQQDDNDYLNAVAQQLQLRARSIITLVDFEIVAVNTLGIGRAVAVADSSHPRNITVYVTDPEGNAVPSVTKTALSTQYADTRMVNAVISIADPAYEAVSVTYTVRALPGVDPVALEGAINARLAQELNPATYGAPTSTDVGLTWVDQPVIHVNRLIGVVSGVAGVDYVESLSISGSNVGQLSGALGTGAPITSLPVTALKNALPAGTYTLTDPTGAHTDTVTTTVAAAVAETSLTISSHTPNFAYPVGSVLSGVVTGDLTMNSNQAGALPTAGTFTGTIDSPTT